MRVVPPASVAVVVVVGVLVATCRLDKLIDPKADNRLTVNRDSVLATGHAGSLQSVTTSMRVGSSDGVTLSWTAAKTAPWVTLSPTPDSLIVTLHADTLAQTLHRDTIAFTSTQTSNSVRVPIVFNVLPPAAELVVSRTSRDTAALVGSAVPDTFTLWIKNAGALPLNWAAALDTGWVTLSDSSSSVPAADSTAVLVTLRPQGLAVGTHQGRIVLTDSAAIGSPDTVRITYAIGPCIETPIASLDAVVSGAVTLSDCGAPQRAGRQAKVYAVQATAGDTLTFRLTAAFDEYLILTNSSGTTVLDSTGVCGIDVTTACIRDIVIPANGAYLVEVTTANAGETGAYTLSAIRERTPSAPATGQFRTDATTAIAVGAVTTQNTVVFKATLNDANTQDSVRLIVEATDVAGTVSDSSAFVPRGTAATVALNGLNENHSYYWRSRACDKTTRCSAWVSFGGNVDPAADFLVNATPEAPSIGLLGQAGANGSMAVGGSAGGTRGGNVTVTFSAGATDPDPGDQISVEVEYQMTGTAFDSTTTRGSGVASGSTASLAVSLQVPLLLVIDHYHWRARVCDQTNQCSAWVSFGGGNPESDADFQVP